MLLLSAFLIRLYKDITFYQDQSTAIRKESFRLQQS